MKYSTNTTLTTLSPRWAETTSRGRQHNMVASIIISSGALCPMHVKCWC